MFLTMTLNNHDTQFINFTSVSRIISIYPMYAYRSDTRDSFAQKGKFVQVLVDLQVEVADEVLNTKRVQQIVQSCTKWRDYESYRSKKKLLNKNSNDLDISYVA